MSRLSKADVIVLSSLVRAPMHGYELKLDLRARHVDRWACCDHGHVYSSLGRLEKKGFIEEVSHGSGTRGRRVFGVTVEGRAWLEDALEQLGCADDSTYFDIDVFVSATSLLDQDRVVAILQRRIVSLRRQLEEALEVERSMIVHLPEAARLVLAHRVSHLEHEIAFAEQTASRLGALDRWGPQLTGRTLGDFPKQAPLSGRQVVPIGDE